jgi:hypothetical protein
MKKNPQTSCAETLEDVNLIGRLAFPPLQWCPLLSRSLEPSSSPYPFQFLGRIEKTVTMAAEDENDNRSGTKDDVETAQTGVLKSEAIQKSWTKRSLWIAYAGYWPPTLFSSSLTILAACS